MDVCDFDEAADDNDSTYEPSIHSDDEADDCAKEILDSDDESEAPIPDSHFRQRTAQLRSQIPEANLLPMVLVTLNLWDFLGIDLPIFLDAVSWGDLGCRQNEKVQHVRTTLMQSDELAGIIRRWHRPPRLWRKGKRPMAARKILDDFVLERVKDRVNDDMKRASTCFLSPPEDFSEHDLTSVNYTELISEAKLAAPFVWELFQVAACTQKQREYNKAKNPDLVRFECIGLDSY